MSLRETWVRTESSGHEAGAELIAIREKVADETPHGVPYLAYSNKSH